MANGARALPIELEPPSSPVSTPAATNKPTTGIEAELAAATVAVALAMLDFQTLGAMAPSTRELGGEALAKVCQIRLEHFGEIDLTAAAAEAKSLLRRRHGAAWRAQYGTELPEAELNTLVGWVLAGRLGACHHRSGGCRRASAAAGVGKLSTGPVF
jgi:hypothetical protein